MKLEAVIFTVSTLMTASMVAAGKRAERVPDYSKPDSDFEAASFNTLASEFLDEYAGKYVVFDGRYMGHSQGVLLTDSRGLPFSVSNLMSAVIGGAPDSSRTVNVAWSMEDRELGRPFLDLQSFASVRIYAYVLPANHKAHLKSRQNQFWKGVRAPVILLIKAVPLPVQ